MAWENRPTLHDRPFVLLPQKGSSDSLQQEVLPRLALVAQFLSQWNGISFWLFPVLLAEADVEVSLDAVGSLSYGALFKAFWFTGSMCTRIGGSKTNPSRKGCFIHIGLGRHPLCTVHATMTCLCLKGDASGPLGFACEWAASHQHYSYRLAQVDHDLSSDTEQFLLK